MSKPTTPRSSFEVLLRGVADLRVDDAVGGEVLRTLPGDARQRLGRLHHPDGVGERLEVQDQVLAIGSPHHPGLELFHVAGREPLVAGLVRQLHDRARPHAAVEVVVEEDLRRLSDALERRRGHAPDGRC
jgi:hypothetical protein